MSSAILKASAHHYGSQCDKANKEFMLCRWEEKDPRKCLKEGMKVNECALNFFRYLTLLPVCPDFCFKIFKICVNYEHIVFVKQFLFLEIPLNFNPQYLSFSNDPFRDAK